MLRAITSGLSSAFAERRLVVLLWVLNIGLALVVAVPFWLWGSGALGTSIEAQVLASGWDGAAFADLMEESSAAIVAFALVTAITIAIAAIGSAFVSSGTLAVLIAHARGREEGAVAGVPCGDGSVLRGWRAVLLAQPRPHRAHWDRDRDRRRCGLRSHARRDAPSRGLADGSRRRGREPSFRSCWAELCCWSG